MTNEAIQSVSQLLATLGQKGKVALERFCLVDMTRDLTSSAIRHSTQTVDAALCLTSAFVEPGDELFQCGAVTAKHSQSLLKAKRMENCKRQKSDQHDF